MIDKLAPIFGSNTKALEMLYLWMDMKPVVRHGFYKGELEKVKEFCDKNNLALEVSQFKVILSDKGKYSNKGEKVSADDPRDGMYFVYISKDKEKAILAATYELKNDHRGLGAMLGYPKCCIDAYVKSAPLMAQGSNDFLKMTVKNSKEYRYPFLTNISRRSEDITLLNHFPCSFGCTESQEIAKRHFRFIKQKFPKLAIKMGETLRGRMLLSDRFFEFY